MIKQAKQWWNKISFFAQTNILICAIVVVYCLQFVHVENLMDGEGSSVFITKQIANKINPILQKIDDDVASGKYSSDTFFKHELENELHEQDSDDEVDIVYFRMYHHNQIKFWNTDKVMPDALPFIAAKDSVFGICQGNTFFVGYKKMLPTDPSKVLWFAIPVKDNFRFNNGIILNENYLDLDLDEGCVIDTVQTNNAQALTLKNKPVLFVNAQKIEHHRKGIHVSNLIHLFGFFFCVYLIYLLFLHLQQRYNRLKCFFVFAAIIALHQVLHYAIGAYFQMSVLDPMQFIFYHFGINYLSLDIYFFSFLLIFILILTFRYKVLPITIYPQSKALKAIVFAVVVFLLICLGIFIYHNIENVLQFSEINFEVSIIESLNGTTFFAYLLISFAVACISLLTSICCYLYASFFGMQSKYTLLYLVLIGLGLSAIYFGLIQSPTLLDYYLIIWVVITIFFLHIPSISKTSSPFQIGTLIWVIYFSIGVLFFVSATKNEKLKGKLLETARQYIPERDVVLEEKFDELVQTYLDKYATSDSTNRSIVHFIDQQLLPIKSNAEYNLDTSNVAMLDSVFQSGEVSLSNMHASYINNEHLKYHYLIKVQLPNAAAKFITCKMIYPATYNALPEFLKYNTVSQNDAGIGALQGNIHLFCKDSLIFANTNKSVVVKKNASNINYYQQADLQYLQYTQGMYTCVVSK
jgi:hypothetical protein